MLIDISQDQERAKAMLALANEREFVLKTIDSEKSPSMKTETYYEIAKELATGLLFTEGKKATGHNTHNDTINFLKDNSLTEEEIILLHDLKDKRNKIQYEGQKVAHSYLERKESRIKAVIDKLKNKLKEKI